jgi:hypothetical protein
MAKVIVERPRHGSRMRGGPKKGYGRRLRRLPLEELPQREGIKRPYSPTKHLNEHLGPLGRYIEAQVGRPWNQVFSEICAFINRNSAVQDHVRDHVFDFVTTDVELIDGVPHRKAGAGRRPWGKPGPLVARGRWGGFYVCPLSGLLKRVKRRWRRQENKPQPPVFVRIDDERQCRLIGGRWSLVQVKKLPEKPSPLAAPAGRPRPGADVHDILLDKKISQIDEAEARSFYGAAVYAVAQRRLSKRELQQLPVPVDLWKGMR